MIETTPYKTKLEEMLAANTKDLKTLGIHNPENSEDWIATPEPDAGGEADPNVAADRVEDWDERRATLATLEKQYNNIKRALKKIENSTYGICEIGGEEIKEDRLSVNPVARTCTTHMEEEAKLPQ